MYNPDFMSEEMVQLIRDAFAEMSSNSDDVEILQDVMNTPGITIIGTEDHLGHYGSLIEDVPGIDAYFKEKYD